MLQLVERLGLDGFSFDLATWEALVNAGLLNGVPPTPSYDCQVPHALEERIRSILEVQRLLGPDAGIDKLAFYAAVAGIADLPATLVGAYMESSFKKFFIVGDGMLRRLHRRPRAIGSVGERRLADVMAKALLRDYPVLDAPSYVACRSLLTFAFILYFRMAWENHRPCPRRPVTRILTPEFLDWTRLPVKTMGEAAPPPDGPPLSTLSPTADRERIFLQLRIACATNPADVIQAARDAALVITSAATTYPELRPGKAITSAKGAFAEWVLTLVPPMLAAALYRVSQRHSSERYANLIPDRKETGLEGVLRTALVYWHT